MTLDTASATFLEAMRSGGGKPLHEQTVEEARANISGASAQFAAPKATVARIDDRRIPVRGGEIGIRIYTPRTDGARLPIVAQFHGGGWVAGDLDTHDSIARYYAAHADAIVISVDYRRPPEHRFPIAVDDSFAAVEWAAAHADELGGDASRLAVAGDSAGGNLATVVCQLAKQRGGPRLVYQALVYPTLDVRDPVITPLYESRAQFGGGEYFLSTRDMEWFRGLYLTDPARDAQDPRASPMAAPDLSGLPPTLIVTAGCDPLRDEAKAYADRLTASDVPVEYRCFDGAIHACMSFAGVIPQGVEALSFVAGKLKKSLSGLQ